MYIKIIQIDVKRCNGGICSWVHYRVLPTGADNQKGIVWASTCRPSIIKPGDICFLNQSGKTINKLKPVNLLVKTWLVILERMSGIKCHKTLFVSQEKN